MNTIIKRVVRFLAKNEAIDDDDVDIYEYGLYVIFSNVIDFAVTFLAAALLGVVPQTILYYISFIGLRRCAGGYHASTRLRCFCISIITWFLSMELIRLTALCAWLPICFAVISCIVIWLYSPVEHSNNPLTPEEIVRMGRLSRIYVSALTVAVSVTLAIVPLGVPDWVASSLSYGMFFFAGSLLVAKGLKKMHTNRTPPTAREE